VPMTSGSPTLSLALLLKKEEDREAVEKDLSHAISGCLTERKHT
jgi:hypothetical protein